MFVHMLFSIVLCIYTLHCKTACDGLKKKCPQLTMRFEEEMSPVDLFPSWGHYLSGGGIVMEEGHHII